MRGAAPVTPASVAYASFSDLIADEQAGLMDRTVVTTDRMVGLPAVGYAVNKIANAVASMSPLFAYRPDGYTRDPAQPYVVARPLATMTVFGFWHMAMCQALTRGNFLGLKADYDDNGFAQQIVPVHADLVNAYLTVDGYPVYEIAGVPYGANDVVHVPGPHLQPGQVWAPSPVQVYRQALGMHVNEQTYGASSFSSGAVPSAVIGLDRDTVPEAVATQVQADWISKHGNGQRKPAVVPRTVSITPLSWSPHDAEFIASRKMSVAEAAYMFDMDPSDLGASVGGQNVTYANIQDRNLSRIIEVYQPWMRRFAEAWTDLVPGDGSCRFDPEAIMRVTPKELAELQKLRIESGVRTVDEERSAEGRAPLPPAPAPVEPDADEMDPPA